MHVGSKTRSPKGVFDDLWNRWRGGEAIIISEEIIPIDLMELEKQTKLNKFKILLRSNKKYLISSLVIGTVIYLIFKNRNFAKKFYDKVKKLFYKLKNVYTHPIFTNRFSRGLITFVRCTSTVRS